MSDACQYKPLKDKLGGIFLKHETGVPSKDQTKSEMRPVLSAIRKQLDHLAELVYPSVMHKLLLHLWSCIVVELHNCLIPTMAFENEITRGAIVRSEA